MVRVVNYSICEKTITKSLFLDRDGVINVKIENGYVTNKNNFKFIDGSLEALKILSKLFDYIIIVTNQAGMEKGLITTSNLEQIHDFLIEEFRKHKINLNLIIHSPFSKNSNVFRKPNVGMAFLAKRILTNISFENSVMIGDSESDILFGKSLNMSVLKIGLTSCKLNDDLITYPDLLTLALNHKFK